MTAPILTPVASLPRVALFAAVALLAACQRGAGTETPEPAFRADVAGVEWQLVELGGSPAPTVAQGRRATLRFEPDTGQAGGFAGCNQYGADYTVSGSALRFADVVQTMMACADGMELETRFTEALRATRGYALRGGELLLYGDGGTDAVLARFRRGGA